MQNKKEWFEVDAEIEKKISDFWDIPVGKSKIRIMTQFEQVFQLSRGKYPKAEMLGMVDSTYKPKESKNEAENEKVSKQGWAWAIIKVVHPKGETTAKDVNELKIVKFGSSILSQLATLKQDGEYQYDGYPMPYDITLSNSGEGADRYTITAARKNTEVTESEIAELNKKKPIAEIIERIRTKKITKADNMTRAPYPEEDIKPEDIPF